jgi:hypothetical protein
MLTNATAVMDAYHTGKGWIGSSFRRIRRCLTRVVDKLLEELREGGAAVQGLVKAEVNVARADRYQGIDDTIVQ